MVDPTMVMEVGPLCQVSVIAASYGTVLMFDTPNGEVKFRISDEEWKRLQDAVWLARERRGIFDSTKCHGCGKDMDDCDGTRGDK